jgi:FixJ family two-component response regulator
MRGRLLLADDDRAVRIVTADLLRRAGFVCQAVTDAGAAIEALDETNYDVLITDVRMPGSDGLLYLADRAERGALPPIIVITGFPELETAMRAIRYAAVEYLAKPFELEDLIRAVSRAIDRKQTEARAEKLALELRTLAERLTQIMTSSIALDSRPEHRGSTYEGPKVADLLTKQERRVVEALDRGFRPREIAEMFGVSDHTVRNQLKSVFRKLGVHSQVELLAELRGDPGFGRD